MISMWSENNDVTSENIPIFGRNRDRKMLSIHIYVLSEMSRLEGITEEMSNMTKTLVERCLYKDMTYFSTIMVFDREQFMDHRMFMTPYHS